jgi:hypothetical protein
MADTVAASVGHSAKGRIRGALISAAIIAAVVAVPATALAAKGHGGTSGGPTPWIALASVNGAAATVHPVLGSSVGFASGYPSTTKNPWVSVMCYSGSTLVYGEGGGPSHQFVLGGASSVWLGAGGAATCTAELGDLYWVGHREYYTYLATTSFSAN